MATKEIRQWVDTLNSVGNAFQSISEDKKARDKETLRQQFLKDLPEQIGAFGGTPEEAQAVSKLEQQAPGTAEKYMLEMIKDRAKGRAEAAKTPVSPFTEQSLAARGVPSNEIPVVMALKDPEKQLKYITEIRGSKETARREESVMRGQKKEFGNRALKISDFENDSKANLDAIDGFIKTGTVPSEAGAAMYIGKLVQGGGVLTEPDVAPYKQKYGAGTVEAAMNYLTGAASGKMSEEHKAALKDLVGLLRDKVENKAKLQKLSLLGESDLIAPDAADSVDEYAKRHGFSKGKAGWEIKSAPVTTKPGDIYTKALKAAEKMPNKEVWQKLIMDSQKSGVAIPPARLKQLGVE